MVRHVFHLALLVLSLPFQSNRLELFIYKSHTLIHLLVRLATDNEVPLLMIRTGHATKGDLLRHGDLPLGNAQLDWERLLKSNRKCPNPNKPSTYPIDD